MLHELLKQKVLATYQLSVYNYKLLQHVLPSQAK